MLLACIAEVGAKGSSVDGYSFHMHWGPCPQPGLGQSMLQLSCSAQITLLPSEQGNCPVFVDSFILLASAAQLAWPCLLVGWWWPLSAQSYRRRFGGAKWQQLIQGITEC